MEKIDEKLLFSLIDIIFDSDDEEENDEIFFIEKRGIMCDGEQRAAPRAHGIQGYVETIVPTYTLDEWKDLFHMEKGTFEILLKLVAPHLPRRAKHSPEKKLLLVIWTLVNPAKFSAVGDRFGVSKSTGHYIFHEIIKIMKKLMYKYVVWPGTAEQKRISEAFQQKSGIPGIVGAIDGCHIPINAPQNNSVDYYNRKGFHSIVLQAVCDDKRRFIDVFIGCPGRMHDAAIYKHSPLFKKALPALPPEFHIMGDGAYPNSAYMITPFKNNLHLPKAKILFNTKLSSVRQVVERSFGLLKGKFPIMKHLNMIDTNAANDVIAACVFLVNFILGQNEIDNEHEELEELDETLSVDNDSEMESNEAITNCKRDQLITLFH